MKKIYRKPTLIVVVINPMQVLSGSDVINPGNPNTPAGARCFSDTDWEEEW